eukprot:c3356_g1_i1.p1 GENE.c3356_g1_i1~~c3356_g1_i1.p1  ORF type:complete len:483 (-),score=121.16 c3356_g1_i1:124-1524(-)
MPCSPDWSFSSCPAHAICVPHNSTFSECSCSFSVDMVHSHDNGDCHESRYTRLFLSFWVLIFLCASFVFFANTKSLIDTVGNRIYRNSGGAGAVFFVALSSGSLFVTEVIRVTSIISYDKYQQNILREFLEIAEIVTALCTVCTTVATGNSVIRQLLRTSDQPNRLERQRYVLQFISFLLALLIGSLIVVFVYRSSHQTKTLSILIIATWMIVSWIAFWTYARSILRTFLTSTIISSYRLILFFRRTSRTFLISLCVFFFGSVIRSILWYIGTATVNRFLLSYAIAAATALQWMGLLLEIFVLGRAAQFLLFWRVRHSELQPNNTSNSNQRRPSNLRRRSLSNVQPSTFPAIALYGRPSVTSFDAAQTHPQFLEEQSQAIPEHPTEHSLPQQLPCPENNGMILEENMKHCITPPDSDAEASEGDVKMKAILEVLEPISVAMQVVWDGTTIEKIRRVEEKGAEETVL